MVSGVDSPPDDRFEHDTIGDEQRDQGRRELSSRLNEAQEDERRRIARELHDELGQSLTAIKLRMEARGRLQGVSPEEADSTSVKMIEDAIEQVRRIALTLRPSLLDDLGLMPALRWLADQAAEHRGLQVHLRAEPAHERLVPEVETTCFRVAQEALTNVARHAQASRVVIDLQQDGGWLRMSVQDDGVGFDAEAARRNALRGGGLGLLGMQGRAMLVGGRLDIESAPGQGTLVRARLPWRARSESGTPR